MKVKYTCEICGKEKTIYNNPNQSFKYCSRKCYNKYRKENRLAEIRCKVCGKTRIVKKSGVERGQYKYCSVECFLIDFNWEKRSGEKLHQCGGGFVKKRLSALERDNFTCQLCKEPATEVHHIIPFRDHKSLKEANKLSNLISLCIPCHQLTFGKEYEFIRIFKRILQGEE